MTLPITHTVRHLCGIAISKRMRRMIVVFRAFFDESGTDRTKNKAFVMGGFLGRVEQWLKASDAWEQCLHDSPRIEYFKHSEYESLDEEFKRFNRAQADQKILALANTIGNFELRGFCSVAPHGIIASKPAEKGLLGSRIYDWGFAGATKIVLDYMQSYPVSEKVDFVFDTRTELRANIEQFNAMKEQEFFAELMSHAGTCEPGTDDEVVALQMADLLAAEFLRAGESRIKSDAFKVIRDKNKIEYQKVTAPIQHVPMLSLMSLGAEIQREAGRFLKDHRQKTMGAEDAIDRMLELKIKEAYFHYKRENLMSFLENDAEYQEFRKKYLASTGIDPMNPSEH